jgi:hypothetical protein
MTIFMIVDCPDFIIRRRAKVEKSRICSGVFCLFVLLSSFVIFPNHSLTQNRVEKEVCSSGVGMNWKTSEEAKAYLLTSAKREAVGQIFGEFIRSVTKVENYQLSRDDIEAYSVGFIRVEGIPEFYNGKGLGEMCVKMGAYVTDGDLARFKAREVKKKVCVADPRLSLGEVRQIAEKQARIQAVKDFEPKLEKVEDEIILKLIHESKTLDGGFVPDTTTYCTTASGVVYPIELTMVNESKKRVTETPQSEPSSGQQGMKQNRDEVKKEWKKVTIRAVNPWTSSGIYVKRGQKIEIKAVGSVNTSSDPNSRWFRWVGPDGWGYAPHPETARYLLPERKSFMCLIGKIGGKGYPFYVGSNLVTKSNDDGILFLGVNDGGGADNWSDNQGSFDVSILLEEL